MDRFTKGTFVQILALVVALWLPFNSHAVGLGAFKVHSALGQPLSAEIEVTALHPDEFARVLARIASPEEYQAANIAYSPLLRQVRVTGERRTDGRSFLNITSVAPINEPTLALLVDFNWRGGRLLQKYAVLLDPPK